MGCGFAAGGYRKHHGAALEWLEGQAPDVALLQEVELAKLASWPGAKVHPLPTSPGARSGTALVVRTEKLEPIAVEIDGALVAAGRARLIGADFLLASAHVLADGKEHRGRQRKALAGLVTKLTELVANGRCIVGGDFNASLHWPEYGEWFFEPMRRAGFEDTRPFAREVQSYWGRGSTACIQDDHVFADMTSRAAVSRGSWTVLADENHRLWSDHGPVVVDIGSKQKDDVHDKAILDELTEEAEKHGLGYPR
jgi:endonuclease/exonuclease/phosphatase family metal-dependent hydrolase